MNKQTSSYSFKIEFTDKLISQKNLYSKLDGITWHSECSHRATTEHYPKKTNESQTIVLIGKWKHHCNNLILSSIQLICLILGFILQRLTYEKLTTLFKCLSLKRVQFYLNYLEVFISAKSKKFSNKSQGWRRKRETYKK